MGCDVKQPQLFIACLLALAAASPGRLRAADDAGLTPEALVAEGVQAFKEGSVDRAVDAWVRGSALDHNLSQKDKMIELLRTLQAQYGQARRWEPVKTVALTPSCVEVYGALCFERGPLYFAFDCFRPESGDWLLARVDFDTDARKILPPPFLAGESR